MSVEEITDVFDVTAEEVKAVLHFASERLGKGANLRLMKILFDHGVPKPIARGLTSHEITYAFAIGDY